jgi:hypothetical protein
MARNAISVFFGVLVVFALVRPAAAQAPPQIRAAIGPTGDDVRLTTRWGKDAGAEVQVGNSKSQSLHAGEASGSLATGHGIVLIGVVVDDDKEPFRLHVLDGAIASAAVKIARPGSAEHMPFALAIAVTPSGFTVFFQEVQRNDPSAAHTYMLALDKQGKPTGKAKEVAVPWSLGAAAWNDEGYHLALFYPGDKKGMRLSMVALSKEGTPLQHPDWASKAGYIADVHLVARSGKVRAFYRGGSGNRLLESDVSKIGKWGREPEKAKDHGALKATQVIAITKKDTAKKVQASRD